MTKYTLLFGIIFSSFSSKLISCDCIKQWSIQETINQSDAVLVGTVIKKEIMTLTEAVHLKNNSPDSTLKNSPIKKLNIARYDFLIQDIYKHYHGAITKDTVTIYSGLNESEWGFKFEVGKKYIIYAENESYYGPKFNGFEFPKSNNVYWTNSCWRTKLFDQGEIDQMELYLKKYKFRPIENNGDGNITSGDETDPLLKGDYLEFIRQNLNYPKDTPCVSGYVQLEFLVDTFGKAQRVRIMRKGLTTEANEEAIRIVKLMNFIPGTRHNKPAVNVMYMSIRFRIKFNGNG